MMDSSVNQSLHHRLKAARTAHGWTLARLAESSGVSRAMISKIERGEVSPTATVLARLANGLGVGMSALFADAETNQTPPLRQREAQAVWRDPATGYLRRNVSPRGLGAAMEIVEVTLPAGERVMFDNFAMLPLAQFVWLLEGELAMTVDDAVTAMVAGDCLHMRLDKPIAFHNQAKTPARYAVVIETGVRNR